MPEERVTLTTNANLSPTNLGSVFAGVDRVKKAAKGRIHGSAILAMTFLLRDPRAGKLHIKIHINLDILSYQPQKKLNVLWKFVTYMICRRWKTAWMSWRQSEQKSRNSEMTRTQLTKVKRTRLAVIKQHQTPLKTRTAIGREKAALEEPSTGTKRKLYLVTSTRSATLQLMKNFAITMV